MLIADSIGEMLRVKLKHSDSRRRIDRLAIWLTLSLLCAAMVGSLSAAPRRVAMENRMTATVDGDAVFVETYPLAAEGLYAFTRRLCGTDQHWRTIAASNRGTRTLRFGNRYKVPVEIVVPDLRFRVLRALFPDDRLESDGWHHQVSGSASLRAIARWFTGAESTQGIQQVNQISGDPRVDQQVLIPAALLRSDLRMRLPQKPRYELTYGEDPRGRYAAYRLAGGEALYSAVVVRFTGRVYAEEVNALAEQIATRSGIADVTDIPIGYQVKIPIEMLMPEFLPAGDSRRVEWETNRAESSQYRNLERTSSLEGVTIVLDAGHGGRDVGASLSGVWESLYVYDVMVRLKQLVESQTSATVFATTREGSTFSVGSRDVLPYSRGHQVLTSPAYAIEDSRVSAHLRWYLSNSHYRRAIKTGSSSRVIFMSIHADSLHPSLRGAMAYIPSAQLRGGSYSKSGTVYQQRAEYRESPRVSLSHKDVVRSEGLSRQLAGNLIGALRKRGIAIHKDKPIRDRIIRKRSFVPAVLRYNQIPAEVLVEVCNLANARDRALIQTANFRQSVAESLFAGLLEYYGEPVPSGQTAQNAGTGLAGEASNSSG